MYQTCSIDGVDFFDLIDGVEYYILTTSYVDLTNNIPPKILSEFYYPKNEYESIIDIIKTAQYCAAAQIYKSFCNSDFSTINGDVVLIDKFTITVDLYNGISEGEGAFSNARLISTYSTNKVQG